MRKIKEKMIKIIRRAYEMKTTGELLTTGPGPLDGVGAGDGVLIGVTVKL